MPYAPLNPHAINHSTPPDHVLATQLTFFLASFIQENISMKVMLDKFYKQLDDIEYRITTQGHG